MNKVFNQIWKGILYLSSAIGLLNLADDIFPSLINFSLLMKVFLKTFVWVRTIILKPITYPLSMIFDIELPSWLQSYFFLGLISWNVYNMAYLKICGSFTYSSPIDLFFSVLFGKKSLLSKLKRFVYSLLLELFLWPIQFVVLIWFHITKEYLKKTHNVYTEWGKYLMTVGKLVLLIIIFNYKISVPKLNWVPVLKTNKHLVYQYKFML